jgi:hypothetical protein
VSPSRSTIAAASSPVAHILSNTSFAVRPLIVPASTSLTSPARASGPTGQEARPRSPSLTLRSTSVITQFEAALALPHARATASK